MMKDNNNISRIKREINNVLDNELDNIDKFCIELAEGKISTY
jgi:S-adenosylmethionine synthetase